MSLTITPDVRTADGAVCCVAWDDDLGLAVILIVRGYKYWATFTGSKEARDKGALSAACSACPDRFTEELPESYARARIGYPPSANFHDFAERLLIAHAKATHPRYRYERIATAIEAQQEVSDFDARWFHLESTRRLVKAAEARR